MHLIPLVLIGQVKVIVITSKAAPHMARGLRRYHRRSLCRRLSADCADAQRMAHGRVRLRTALARILHDVVVEDSHQLVGVRRVVDHSSHQPGDDRRVVGHSGHREDHRHSSRAAVECDDGSRHGVGCSHEVDHDDRSNRQVVGHSRRDHRRGSQANEIESARAVVEHPLGAI